jgi:hypothetical protein
MEARVCFSGVFLIRVLANGRTSRKEGSKEEMKKRRKEEGRKKNVDMQRNTLEVTLS